MSQLESPVDGLGLLLVPSWISHYKMYGSQFSSCENYFFVYDLDRQSLKTYVLPLGLSHSVVTHPLNKEEVLIIEKDAPLACRVDINTGKVSRTLQASDDCLFSGHGIFSLDGNYLYIIEYPIGNNEASVIVVRDAYTFECIAKLETGGFYAHDLLWMSDSKTLAVSHYGMNPKFEPSDGLSSISLLDPMTGKICHTLSLVGQTDARLCHFLKTKKDEFFVGASNYIELHGAVNDERREVMKNYQRLRERGMLSSFQSLPVPIIFGDLKTGLKKDIPSHLPRPLIAATGLAYNPEKNIVAVVFLKSQNIIFWCVDTKVILHYFELEDEGPSGVVLSRNHRYFIVNTNKGRLLYFDAYTFKLVHQEFISDKFSLGNFHSYIL